MGAGRTKSIIMLACAGVAGITLKVHAQNTVENPNFLTPSTGGYIDDGNAEINTPGTTNFWDWGYYFGQTGTADKDAGVQANTNGQLTNPPSGSSQSGWVNGSNDYLYQDVGALAANTTYDLTVSVAAPGGTAYGGVGAGNNQPTDLIALLNGDNVLTTTNNVAAVGTVLNSLNVTPNNGTWTDYSVSYTTGAVRQRRPDHPARGNRHRRTRAGQLRRCAPDRKWRHSAESMGRQFVGRLERGLQLDQQHRPQRRGAAAEFLSSITSNHTVFTDAADTVGTLTFDNANTYEITGTGSLTLQTTSGSAQVNVQEGSQEINLPTTLASNTVFNVSSGATLTIGNPLTINSGVNLTQTGSGSVVYNSIINVGSSASIAFADSTHAHELSVASGGTASITSPSGGVVLEVDSLANSGTVNVANNEMLINYGSGTSPLSTVISELKTGYNGGAWNGPGIDSTSAHAHAGYGLGFADAADSGNPAHLASGTVEVKYVLLGDANLDGTVNGTDFSILAANFGLGVTNWDQGNFLFTSSVNGSDFSALASNFGLATMAPLMPVFLRPTLPPLTPLPHRTTWRCRRLTRCRSRRRLACSVSALSAFCRGDDEHNSCRPPCLSPPPVRRGRAGAGGSFEKICDANLPPSDIVSA